MNVEEAIIIKVFLNKNYSTQCYFVIDMLLLYNIYDIKYKGKTGTQNHWNFLLTIYYIQNKY